MALLLKVILAARVLQSAPTMRTSSTTATTRTTETPPPPCRWS